MPPAFLPLASTSTSTWTLVNVAELANPTSPPTFASVLEMLDATEPDNERSLM